MLGEVGRWVNAREGSSPGDAVTPERLAELIRMAEAGTITGAVAKDVFERMASTGKSAEEIVQASGLSQMSGEDELLDIVKKAIAGNERAAADYRAGKEVSIKRLLGDVMRETRGRANPQVAESLLVQELRKK
nr:GatB domain protein [uncultured bacterium]